MNDMTKRMTPTARLSRESKLLLELQNGHGYRWYPLKPKDSYGLLATLPTSKTGKPGATRKVMFVKLAVPDDSALGQALAKDAEHTARMRSRRAARR